MKLNVIERLVLLGMLPAEGSYSNLKLLRIAKESLSFDERENKILNFRVEAFGDEQRTVWNEGVEDKEVKIGEIVTQMIVKALKKLDDEENLKAEHESLYEKFIKS